MHIKNKFSYALKVHLLYINVFILIINLAIINIINIININ